MESTPLRSCGESVELAERGRYAANNLAFNCRYGVLTEDEPLLTQFLDGALAAGGENEGSDVVGAAVRGLKGEILAKLGKPIKNLPTMPAAVAEEREALTTDGEPVLLFRAPVPTGSSGSEGQVGGVEVAINRSLTQAQRRWRFLRATFMGLLVALGSTVGSWLGRR